MIVSSSLINFSEPLYQFVRPAVAKLQRKNALDILPDEEIPPLADHVVIIGADRVGHVVIDYLKRAEIETLVLDYNPTTVRRLRSEGFRTLYGDVSDPEMLESLQLDKAKLVISTASGLRDSLALLDACKRKHTKAKVVVRTVDTEHDEVLRKAGASYVILPERVTGDFLVSKLEDEWPNLRFS
jgi:Trk K+ transport system NAD-binding subunit